MLTKAYIEEVPTGDNNTFRVRIPYLEDNTGTEMIYDALLCNQPGQYNAYKKGDCVYVMFEGETMNYPVIIGDLYTGETPHGTSYISANQLSVNGSVTLPSDSKFQYNDSYYSPQDLFKLYQRETGTIYKAGYGINIDDNNVISVSITQAKGKYF